MIADNPFLRQPDEKELFAVAAAARDFGKLSIAHATTRKGQQTAQEAKVDFITHTPLDEAIDEAFAKKMVDENRCAIPTLIMMKMTAEGKGDMNRAPGTEAKKNFSMASNSVKIMHDAGVPILAGDDHNTKWFTPAKPDLGNCMHQELKLLVDAGLSTVEALRAATVVPAQRFKLWDRGVVSPGCRADLILLKKDPTVDTTNIETIKQVWFAGVSWTPDQSLLDHDGYDDCGGRSSGQE